MKMDMEQIVIALLARQLEVEPELLHRDTDIMKDLGADSLDIAELITTVEETYGILVEDEDLSSLVTVGNVSDYLATLVH